MFRTTNYIYCKISPIHSLLCSLLVVLYRRRKLIYYIHQNGFTFPNYWAIHSPMFNYHSLIPWGSFRGGQEEKWGSFRGRDHFRVGDHFGVGIISGAVHTSPEVKFDAWYIKRQGRKSLSKNLFLFLSVHWGDLIEQIKKTVIYTLTRKERRSCEFYVQLERTTQVPVISKLGEYRVRGWFEFTSAIHPWIVWHCSVSITQFWNMLKLLWGLLWREKVSRVFQKFLNHWKH